MARGETELLSAKRAYKSAQDVGNRKEESRWANVIGDIFKKRGEYVEALTWFRKDYDISLKFLLEKDLLPACQSIGELYLRLQQFLDALHFQKEHLRLAREANDLVEQQRATTQLGRTYHELFSKSEDDYSALHNAKKYFKSAMSLAKTLKENPPDSKSSFLKEYIDAHNNVGMLEMDLDNLEEAEKILSRGLEICDEEEVNEDDDARSRLHHNLGFVYTRLRKWDKAREHIKKDILICRNIGHRQGEAKGYNNLGELYVQFQKFQEALSSYQKALELAKSMEDEYALAKQIKENIRVVKEYVKVMEEMIKEEQNLKKLKRSMAGAQQNSGERKCLKQQMASLDGLLDKAFTVSAWSKHLEFAKMKKRITSELFDKEKLGDSFFAVGESYQKLRNFQKARKWYNKSWDIYKQISNLEGQAIIKINMGDVLDSEGDPKGALRLFEEGYRIAVQVNKIHIQITALENMHYCHMMRFDNGEEARSLQREIDNLKNLMSIEQVAHTASGDSCSETETEGNDDFSRNRSIASESSQSCDSLLMGSPFTSIEEDNGTPHSINKLLKQLTKCEGRVDRTLRTPEASPQCLPKSLVSPSTSVSRKRARLVLSDDEDDAEGKSRRHADLVEDIATSNEFKARSDVADVAYDLHDLKPIGYEHYINVHVEESSCSHKSTTPQAASVRHLKSLDECCIRMKVEDVPVCIEVESCMFADEIDLEALKVQAACSYYLQLSSQKKSNGLLPIIGQLKSREQVLASVNLVEHMMVHAQAGNWIEASVNGWVQKRLIKMYIECCQKLSEVPNRRLLMKLYNLEVSEDEIIVSDCELQDMSIVPLLEALQVHKAISMLDLSHNKLGNATMEKLQQVFMLSNQKYGTLILDLHSNMFGPTTLFQICECPLLCSRLEVLNLSGNRLTDACASYLSTILQNCKALYSLNIERCCITSRAIQAIADVLDSGSVLSQLFVGYNNPVSGGSLANLIRKLATVERFSELSLNGIKLSKPVLNSVCQLARSSCLSGLMLGETNIGCDGALQLTESLFHETQELVKFNLSYCGLTHKYFEGLKTQTPAFCNIIELTLAGNPIMPEGASALASLLTYSQCSMKLLNLNKCHLGLSGIIQIIKSLAENESLEELNLADNVEIKPTQSSTNEATEKKTSEALEPHDEQTKAVQNEQHGKDDLCLDQLEAADSYDNSLRAEHAAESGLDDSCTSQGRKGADRLDNQSIEELSLAISNATALQLLDLSNNGFSTEVAECLYKRWSSNTRVGLPRRHVKGQILHLSIQGKNCCRVKSCCRKD